ncbi:MAG: GAF domain-containing protein [Phycisphaerales bacterium]|nr:GAF domain-containing protein [Phycisphaerales bacterium]
MSSQPVNSNPSLHSVPTHRHEVLLVGGDFAASREIRLLLESAGGVGVTLCVRTTDATDEAIRTCPTVILVDLRLPGVDGLQVVDALERCAEIGAVPTIILATQETDSIREAAFARGVSDFIIFPVSTTELIAKVRTHSNGYLNVLKRNRSIAAYESLQSELRTSHRALEEHRRIGSLSAHEAVDPDWQIRLNGLMQIGVELHLIQDLQSLLDRILSEARHLLRATAGTIFLREGDTLRFAFFQNDELAHRTASGETPHVPTFSLPVCDRSIAGWVCLTGQLVNIPDCYRIPADAPYRFDSSFDSLLGFRTRSMVAVPLTDHAGRIHGVIELINPVSDQGNPRVGFPVQDTQLMEHFANIATLAINRAHHRENEMRRMLKMAEFRDADETGGHIERVAGYSAVIFEEWSRRRGLEGPAFERQRDRLRDAARVHDVGKMAISDVILRKTGQLDAAEYEEVKKHTQRGSELFSSHNPSDLDDARREVALLHHERWDGKGYPGIEEAGRRRGRRGEEIPLFARIVGLSDVFDALSTRRCYKEAWDEARVLEFMQGESNRHFDPELVEIFFAQLDAIRTVRDAHRDHL